MILLIETNLKFSSEFFMKISSVLFAKLYADEVLKILFEFLFNLKNNMKIID